VTDEEAKALTEQILRIVREEIRGGQLDRKALRARLRDLAKEVGARPPPDPRQLTIEGVH
jgi:hypothetical protein